MTLIQTHWSCKRSGHMERPQGYTCAEQKDHAKTHRGQVAVCRPKREVLEETKYLGLGLLAPEP